MWGGPGRAASHLWKEDAASHWELIPLWKKKVDSQPKNKVIPLSKDELSKSQGIFQGSTG